jgi:hypothetical protein
MSTPKDNLSSLHSLAVETMREEEKVDNVWLPLFQQGRYSGMDGFVSLVPVEERNDGGELM